MWPRFSVTSPNSPGCCVSQKRNKTRSPQREHLNFHPALSFLIFFFLQLCPVLPDVGKASSSSGLNVASAVDSQAHKESYIYGINDTLHPPHNSCLLHLVDWDCRHSHSTTTGESRQLLVAFSLCPIPGTSGDTPMLKQTLVLMPVSIMIVIIHPPPPLFVFLLTSVILEDWSKA